MDLRARARHWLACDPDPGTRTALAALLDRGDEIALAELFDQPLTFGTAGIRGPLGPGPARMNRAVVRRVTAGLATRLRADGPAAGRVVVVGRDARHGSAAFAADTAGVLARAGFDVRLLDQPLPTPLVAFAVRHLGAAAGVQITASHNPAADNGYKVYWAGGAQIAPPLDAEIAAAAAAAADDAVAGDLPTVAPTYPVSLGEAYASACLGVLHAAEHRAVRIVYTPLHGVAGELATTLLARAGFRDVVVVAEQFAPDPNFPTVTFPNPEEPGALDLALDLAARQGADLVLANDPDGDRIAVAIPSADGWRALTGDEVGCLLAEYVLRRTSGDDRVVATTVVSSRVLSRSGHGPGAGGLETQNRVKWLGDRESTPQNTRHRLLLAYEQALGVMVGTAVLDKDGLSAALLTAELAAGLAATGRTLVDALDDLARRHGVHATTGRSLRLDAARGGDLATRVIERLRAAPPASVGGVAVTAVADHVAGTVTTADGAVTALTTPPTDLVGLTLADGSRLQVRPSGTEPLLKCYAEVVEPVPADESLAAARARAGARLEALADAWLATVTAAA